jgi:hypothetical protein
VLALYRTRRHLFVLVAPFIDCIICSLLRTVWFGQLPFAHRNPALNSLVSSARLPEVVCASGRISGCTWCSISYACSAQGNSSAYRLVRTKSFACMRNGPICPFLALFLMSATSFFSWFSSLTRSRSSSRCVFSSARWCFLSLSAGVIRLPKAHSTIFMIDRRSRIVYWWSYVDRACVVEWGGERPVGYRGCGEC